MAEFATLADIREAIVAVRDLAERLPVLAVSDLGALLDAVDAVDARLAAVPTVKPADAVGTHHLRELRRLPPIGAAD